MAIVCIVTLLLIILQDNTPISILIVFLIQTNLMHSVLFEVLLNCIQTMKWTLFLFMAIIPFFLMMNQLYIPIHIIYLIFEVTKICFLLIKIIPLCLRWVASLFFFSLDNFSDRSSLFDDPPHTPLLQSKPSLSPLRSRPAAGSDSALFDTVPYMWSSPATSPLKKTIPPTTGKYNSPQRQRRLTSSRTRGGSPGSPDPSNELKIEDVISGKDKRTTLMIKNIPNAYSLSFSLQ